MDLRLGAALRRLLSVLSGKTGVLLLLALIFLHSVASLLLPAALMLVVCRQLQNACYGLGALMLIGAAYFKPPEATLAKRVIWMIAAGASLWTLGMVSSDLLRAYGIKTYPGFADLIFMTGNGMFIGALCLVPRKPLGRHEVVNELIDLACLTGVVLAIIWGAVDAQVHTFTEKFDSAVISVSIIYLIVDMVMMMLAYWTLVRRDPQKVPLQSGLWLLLSLVFLAMGDTLQLRAMAVDSRILDLIVMHTWCVQGLCLGLAGFTALNARSQIATTIRRHVLVLPRATILLWTSLAWVGVSIGLLLRDCLYPDSMSFPMINALMGGSVLLLVAIRQGRNLTDLSLLSRQLDASNRDLATANMRLQDLNKQITEQARREVNKLSARVEELFEHTPWGIFFFKVNDDGSFAYETMNPALEKRYGKRRDETNFDTIMAALTPEVRSSFEENLRMCVREHIAVEFETSMTVGRFLRHSAISLIPIVDEGCHVVSIAGFHRDITTEYEALVSLRESEDKFHKVFRTCPDGIVISDFASGRILETNPQYAHMMGYDEGELIGKLSLEIGGWASPEQRSRMLNTLRTKGKIHEFEMRMHHHERTMVDCLYSAESIEVNGVPCIISFFKDVTASRLAEEAKRKAIEREQLLSEEYTRKLILSQEAERRRIAGGLHDSIGQDLLIIKNRLQMACEVALLPAPTKSDLEELSLLAVHAITEVRRISHALRPHQLDHLGLTVALKSMIDNVGKSTECRYICHLDNIDDLFDIDQATSIYRIAQEGLNNIVKHAQASEVTVLLERDIHVVSLSIEDNGRGFDSKILVDGNGLGLGMGNLHERARMLGGTLHMNSTQGSGTRMQLTIPIKAETEIADEP